MSNYFIGSDPSAWRTGVAQYGRVTYRDLYPGIDLSFYGNQAGRLEYDFTVRPEADPSLIHLGFTGAEVLHIDSTGDLVIDLPHTSLVQPKPGIYQVVGGARTPISGGYALDGDQLSFAIGGFDRTRPLLIDPEVKYSTYLGGSLGGDLGEAHPTADDSGHAFICGETNSTDFPVTKGAYQTQFTASYSEAFVTEMNTDGSGLVYSTYLGGTGDQVGVACALDPQGDLYIAGATTSTDFPTTPHAFQRQFNGGDGAVCGEGLSCDAYVAKLSPDGGTLIYSTYVGGSRDDSLVNLSVDPQGYAYAAGATSSSDFPTTPGAFQPSNAGGRHVSCSDHRAACDYVVVKLNRDGSDLIYSTYLGGPGAEGVETGFAIDQRGDAYVGGATTSRRFPVTPGAFQPRFKGGPDDLTVSKLDPSGSHLIYATYLGGSGSDDYEGIAVDARGYAYLAGGTASTDFPVTHGAFQTKYHGGDYDIFVTKLNPQGNGLVYSTYLGGSGGEATLNALIDPRGHVYVSGGSDSTDFPVTAAAFQSTNHGATDGTLTELNRDGSGLIFSTYWGGSGDEGFNGGTLDHSGNFYGTGCTDSTDFPTTDGAFEARLQGGEGTFCLLPNDAFVTKFALDENDDQAKPIRRGPSNRGQAALGQVWLGTRWLVLDGRR